jgi:ERCC4-type nuclease
MKNQENGLRELKGIGKVLSQRLCESSYDSIAKVAAASEKGLERIEGMSPRKVHSITIQARQMTGQAEKSHHSWSEER